MNRFLFSSASLSFFRCEFLLVATIRFRFIRMPLFPHMYALFTILCFFHTRYAFLPFDCARYFFIPHTHMIFMNWESRRNSYTREFMFNSFPYGNIIKICTTYSGRLNRQLRKKRSQRKSKWKPKAKLGGCFIACINNSSLLSSSFTFFFFFFKARRACGKINVFVLLCSPYRLPAFNMYWTRAALNFFQLKYFAVYGTSLAVLVSVCAVFPRVRILIPKNQAPSNEKLVKNCVERSKLNGSRLLAVYDQ